MPVNTLSLLELNSKIKEAIKSGTEKAYWVTGEISEIKINYSGHCYLELIQKNEESDQIVARSRATIWAQTFRLIKPYFETTTGQPLVQGLVILVKASVEFHEVFGLSLNILDIEPAFTIGELALRKQKVIDRLTEEGVITMNRELELPLLSRKIAVISSETAAGYGDFVDQLVNNSFGYKFYCKLFPAVMQGDEAEQSIIKALDRIYSYEDFFDIVVIIRGGGSQADLSCFNSYWLAYHITQFPLPVLTGIGHEQDDSVVDLVAHTRLKTPTAVAVFLIDHLTRVEDALNTVAIRITDEIRSLVEAMKNDLLLLIKNLQLNLKDTQTQKLTGLLYFIHSMSNRIHKILDTIQQDLNRSDVILDRMARRQVEIQTASVETLFYRIQREVLNSKKQVRKDLDSVIDRLRILDPLNVLKRGYSITCKGGIPLKEIEYLSEGNTIETLLHKGKIHSTIKKLMP